MSDARDGDRFSPFPDGFVVPIAGLLALIFAVLAGAASYPLLSGDLDPQSLSMAAAFAGASVVAFWVRKRRLDATAAEDDAAG